MVPLSKITSYHGGKQKIGYKIAAAITDFLDEIDILDLVENYCEPFFGMGGVYREMIPLLPEDAKYYAGDINVSVIKMWKELQKGWIPPTKCVESTFRKLKDSRTKEEGSRKNSDKTAALKGYLGHACSFRGRYFGTFSQDKNLVLYSNRLQEMGEEFSDVKFSYGSYTDYSKLKNSLLYLDPPYSGTDQRYSDGNQRSKFDNDAFWQWSIAMARTNVVVVSEQSIPEYVDHLVLWQDSREYLFLILPQ